MKAYLDNSATTRPCERAMERMRRSMLAEYHNPSALYAPAIAAERAMDACRKRILSSVRADSFALVFTSGGTEANNLAILGGVSAMRGLRRVAAATTEHPSVLAAFETLRAMGHAVCLLPVDETGAVEMGVLEAELKNGLDFLSVMQVNNETGVVNDIQAISAMARRIAPDLVLHVDGVQGYLRLAFDARLADLYTLSAHKIHGPKGIGALLVRGGLRILPRQVGGGQEGGLRSGTENTVGIAGLLGAAEHMQALGEAEGPLMERKLRLYQRLAEGIPALCVNGSAPRSGAPHIINLSFPGVRAEVLLHALEQDGVLCATGAACSSKKRKVSAVLQAMGIPVKRAESALRFSLSPDTTEAEIAYAAERILFHYEKLKEVRRR